MHPVLRFTYLSFELNHLLDSGQSIDLSETKRRIEDHTVLDWLSEKYGSDLSLYEADDRRELVDFFIGLLECCDEEREMGVANNGLCLLLAYCIEGVQQHTREWRERSR